MTQDQFMGLLRQVLPILGTVFTALGWVSAGTSSAWMDLILQIAGPAFVLWGVIWAFIANGKGAITQSVAAMPETSVKPGTNGSAVITINDPTLAATAIKAATPAAKT